MTPAGPSASGRPEPSTSAQADLQQRCEQLAAEVDALEALVAGLLHRHEDERRIVARALHDGAGGSLTAIRMAAHAALSEDDPGQRKADLDSVVALAGDALDRIRGLCADLRPPPLDAVGLDAALRWHVGRLEAADRARIVLRIGPLPRRPAPEVEQAAYRIVEDALADALRHAGAGTIVVGLEVQDAALHLEVRDDATGHVAPAQAVPGPGIGTMRARARAVGGRLERASTPGQGTRVLAVLPFS